MSLSETLELLSPNQPNQSHPRCCLGLHEPYQLLPAGPGVTIFCRDEHLLVSNVARTTRGFRIWARGVSHYVRDTTSTFFTALDDIEVFDPTNVTVPQMGHRSFATPACGWSPRFAARRCRCTESSWKWPCKCWRSRFAIPLVRLDSQSIQQVRQKLPASKSPFIYFPRVVVSMDTLES